MKILIVEDDRRTADFVRKGLQQAGYACVHAADGREGLEWFAAESFDLAIVDIMLPFMDGLSLINEVRDRGITTPVLVLSARKSVDDRIRGLRAGGDDYMVKPFDFAELLARIQAILRRARPAAEATDHLRVADLEFDLVRRRVYRQGREIELQARELSLLEYLMRNSGHVVSKTMIISQVWDYGFDPHTNVVEARICRLRDKIDRPFSDPLIHTVRGVGYVLEKRD